MAIAKTTLNHLFSWCPLGGYIRFDNRERHAQASMDELPASGSQLTGQIDGAVHGSMAPDLRQCEPWRQPLLREATTRNDPEQHKRLTR